MRFLFALVVSLFVTAPSGGFPCAGFCADGGAGTGAIVANFSCKSFGQSVSDGGTLNISYKTPINCWGSASTVSGVAVNGTTGTAGESFVPEVHFDWNWDDSSQGTASRTATAWDLGKAIGVTASHVYAPSTFAETCNGGANSLHTLTLTVTALVSGARASDSETLSVCVENPATTWPTPRAYCDDADCSNDTFTGVVNAGTPTHGGNGTALQTILAWCGANSSQRILVENITWTATAAAALGLNSCLIESYGASKATFDFNVGADRMTLTGCAKMRISEVTISGDDTNNMLLNASDGEGCVLFDDWNVSTTVGERLSGVVHSGGQDLTELYFNNFDYEAGCSQGAGCTQNAFFLQADNSAFINGKITASGEHSIRFPNWRYVVVDSMYLAMPGTHTAGKDLLALRQDCRNDDDATGLPCTDEASAHTVAVTRSEFRPADDGAVAVQLSHDGNSGLEGTQEFDLDFIGNVFAKVNDANSLPRVYIDTDPANGFKLERLRFVRNAADLTWMDSSTESALHKPRGGTDYYIAGNALSCEGNCANPRSVVDGVIGGAAVVKNNVGYAVGGVFDLFPDYAESADNQEETADPFDRDGAAPGTDASFTFADVLITSGNTAIKGQGVVSAYPTDVEGESIPQSSDYDAGVDDE